MENSQKISFRLSKELLSALDSYALSLKTSRSSALCKLLEIGLDRVSLSSELQDIVVDLLSSYLDRMFKVSSRGTKASLANLIMSSAYLPCVAALAEEACDLTIKEAKEQSINLETDKLNIAISRSGKFHGASSQQAMKYAWNAGGQLQQTGSKMDFSLAVKGLSTPSTNIKKIKDFWSEG